MVNYGRTEKPSSKMLVQRHFSIEFCFLLYGALCIDQPVPVGIKTVVGGRTTNLHVENRTCM